MKSLAKVTMGAAGITGLSFAGWPVVFVFVVLTVALCGVGCWILASTERTGRLSWIISACRQEMPLRRETAVAPLAERQLLGSVDGGPANSKS